MKGTDEVEYVAYYYYGSDCSNDAVHVGSINSCDGYGGGAAIGSFSVQC